MNHFFFGSRKMESAAINANPKITLDLESMALGQMVRAAVSSFFRSDSLIRTLAERLRLDTPKASQTDTLEGNKYIVCNQHFVDTDTKVDIPKTFLLSLLDKTPTKVATNLLLDFSNPALLHGNRGNQQANTRGIPYATLVPMRINSEGIFCSSGNTPLRYSTHAENRSHFWPCSRSAVWSGAGEVPRRLIEGRSLSELPAQSSALCGFGKVITQAIQRGGL